MKRELELKLIRELLLVADSNRVSIKDLINCLNGDILKQLLLANTVKEKK